MKPGRMFTTTTGKLSEGAYARDEEHAVQTISAHNWRCYRLKKEARAAAAKAAIRAKITLPKLKFMDGA